MMEKRVLITGGTKGIGRAVAECLAKAGYSLILTYASDKEEALRVADGLLQQYKWRFLRFRPIFPIGINRKDRIISNRVLYALGCGDL